MKSRPTIEARNSNKGKKYQVNFKASAKKRQKIQLDHLKFWIAKHGIPLLFYLLNLLKERNRK